MRLTGIKIKDENDEFVTFTVDYAKPGFFGEDHVIGRDILYPKRAGGRFGYPATWMDTGKWLLSEHSFDDMVRNYYLNQKKIEK